MDKALRIKKFADTLGCSVPTIRRLVHKGLLPSGVRLPGSRVVVWFESDVTAYLEEVKKQAKPPVLVHRKTWRSTK